MSSMSFIRSEHRRFGAFILAGIINTLFGYGAFALLLWAGIGNDLAVLFGMIAGIAFNYGTIGHVFATQGFARLPHFLFTYAILMVANIAALRVMVAGGMNSFLAEAIILICIVPVSFLAMRFFVFLPKTGPVALETEPENLSNRRM
jgi:putative flippase GtrA